MRVPLPNIGHQAARVCDACYESVTGETVLDARIRSKREKAAARSTVLFSRVSLRKKKASGPPPPLPPKIKKSSRSNRSERSERAEGDVDEGDTDESPLGLLAEPAPSPTLPPKKNRRRTGSVPKVQVTYHADEDSDDNDGTAAADVNVSKNAEGPAAALASAADADAQDENSDNASLETDDFSTTTATIDPSDDESSDELPPPVTPGVELVRTLYDYHAQEDGELTLTAGALLRIVDWDESSAWWIGEVLENGEGSAVGERGQVAVNYIVDAEPTAATVQEPPPLPKKKPRKPTLSE